MGQGSRLEESVTSRQLTRGPGEPSVAPARVDFPGSGEQQVSAHAGVQTRIAARAGIREAVAFVSESGGRSTGCSYLLGKRESRSREAVVSSWRLVRQCDRRTAGRLWYWRRPGRLAVGSFRFARRARKRSLALRRGGRRPARRRAKRHRRSASGQRRDNRVRADHRSACRRQLPGSPRRGQRLAISRLLVASCAAATAARPARLSATSSLNACRAHSRSARTNASRACSRSPENRPARPRLERVVAVCQGLR